LEEQFVVKAKSKSPKRVSLADLGQIYINNQAEHNRSPLSRKRYQPHPEQGKEGAKHTGLSWNKPTTHSDCIRNYLETSEQFSLTRKHSLFDRNPSDEHPFSVNHHRNNNKYNNRYTHQINKDNENVSPDYKG
jgi:hypothetical protein